MDFLEVECVWVWTGSSWLRIGAGGGHLWLRWWTLGFHKMQGISWLAEKLLVFHLLRQSTTVWYINILKQVFYYFKCILLHYISFYFTLFQFYFIYFIAFYFILCILFHFILFYLFFIPFIFFYFLFYFVFISFYLILF